MREAYNEEEVDILKYGQWRSVLKEKQKKLNFFRKRCWHWRKSVVLYTSCPVRTGQNAEKQRWEKRPRGDSSTASAVGSEKKISEPRKKVLTNAERCGKINRLSPPLSGRERKKKSKKCLTKATEYDIMNKLLNARANEGESKKDLEN